MGATGLSAVSGRGRLGTLPKRRTIPKEVRVEAMPELFGPCPKCRQSFKTMRGLVHHRCLGDPPKRRSRKVHFQGTLDCIMGIAA